MWLRGAHGVRRRWALRGEFLILAERTLRADGSVRSRSVGWLSRSVAHLPPELWYLGAASRVPAATASSSNPGRQVLAAKSWSPSLHRNVLADRRHRGLPADSRSPPTRRDFPAAAGGRTSTSNTHTRARLAVRPVLEHSWPCVARAASAIASQCSNLPVARTQSRERVRHSRPAARNRDIRTSTLRLSSADASSKRPISRARQLCTIRPRPPRAPCPPRLPPARRTNAAVAPALPS